LLGTFGAGSGNGKGVGSADIEERRQWGELVAR